MIIGDRLRLLRGEKNLSQGDIEERTGLLRSYLSRVENGHTIPSVETLEKMARAMDMELYQLLYDGPEPPSLPIPSGKASRDSWGSWGKDARSLTKLRRYLSQMTPRDQRILMAVVSELFKATTRRNPKGLTKPNKSALVSARNPHRTRHAVRHCT
jgi:transcriptional regulator with XRE-family HTH domain